MIKNRRAIHLASRVRHIYALGRTHRPQNRHKTNRHRHSHFRHCIKGRSFRNRRHTYGQHIMSTHGANHYNSNRRRTHILHIRARPTNRALTRRHTGLTQDRLTASQRTNASSRGLRRRVRSNLPSQRRHTTRNFFSKQRLNNTHTRRPPRRNHSNNTSHRKSHAASNERIRQTKFVHVLSMSGDRAFSLMRRRHRRAHNHAGNSTSSNRHHSRHQGATSIQLQFHLILQLVQRRYFSRITYASSSIHLIIHVISVPTTTTAPTARLSSSVPFTGLHVCAALGISDFKGVRVSDNTRVDMHIFLVRAHAYTRRAGHFLHTINRHIVRARHPTNQRRVVIYLRRQAVR